MLTLPYRNPGRNVGSLRGLDVQLWSPKQTEEEEEEEEEEVEYGERRKKKKKKKERKKESKSGSGKCLMGRG